MIRSQGTNDGAMGRFASMIGAESGWGVSMLVLHCIKELHDAHLSPVDLTEDGETDMYKICLRMIDILRKEGFVAGPDHQALLTSKAHKSVRVASKKYIGVKEYLEQGQAAITRHDPRQILLSILRAHFEEWQIK